MVFQQILNGLTNGSIYALLAIGVTMIYKSLGMLNFAHGDTIMISAFICLTLITVGIPIPLAIVLTIIAAVHWMLPGAVHLQEAGVQFFYKPSDCNGGRVLYHEESGYCHLGG